MRSVLVGGAGRGLVVLVGVASLFAMHACTLSIACEVDRPTSCPPDLTCDVATRTCVDGAAGDGDGDQGSPCAGAACTPEVVADGIAGPTVLATASGELFLGTAPSSGPARVARVDTGSGALSVLSADHVRVGQIAVDAAHVWWVDDTYYSGFDEVWRAPKDTGAAATRVFEGDGAEEIVSEPEALAVGGGYAFFLVDGGELYRADQQGPAERVAVFSGVRTVVANEQYAFLGGAQRTYRLEVGATLSSADDAVVLPGARDGRAPLTGAVFTDDDGSGYLVWATEAEDGAQGNLVRSDFEGGDWVYLVEGVDPEGDDDEAEVVAVVARRQIVYYAVDVPGPVGGALYQAWEGAAPERLLTVDDPRGLAVGGGWLYYTAHGEGRVGRLPLD